MAADNPAATESVTADVEVEEAYVTPAVDFAVLAVLVSTLAITAVAVMLP